MQPFLARKMWATLEPIHAMVYFAPEAYRSYDDLGFSAGGMGYFASRSAAMGAVSAAVVTSTFYNFNPGLVARHIPAAWELAAPEVVVAARFRAASDALSRLVPDPAEEELMFAATTAEEAVSACPTEGRALFAAHAALPAPDDPMLRLWWALTQLREFRGDGHVTALVDAGLSGVEAVASYAATGEVFGPDFYRHTRGWSTEAWESAMDALRARGWVDGAGELTDAGRDGRERIEEHTDRLAMAPWEAIGEERADRLRATVRPWSRSVVAAGGLQGPGL